MAEFHTAPAGAGTGEKLLTWVDNRFPLSKLYNEHLGQYYAPKNFNIFYVFGALAMLVLVMQILTGIFLTMNYKPDAARAFESVEYIMRDVPWGWLVRYMHSTGASAFFIVVFLTADFLTDDFFEDVLRATAMRWCSPNKVSCDISQQEMSPSGSPSESKPNPLVIRYTNTDQSVRHRQ